MTKLEVVLVHKDLIKQQQRDYINSLSVANFQSVVVNNKHTNSNSSTTQKQS